jgi:hypothetical protein
LLYTLKVVAKAMPFLQTAIERFIDSLQRKELNPQQIIQARLGTQSGSASAPNAPGQVESQGGARAEARPLAEPRSASAVRAPAPGDNPTAQPADGTSVAAQELALRQIQQDFQDGRERIAARLAQVQRQDTAVFGAMLASGVISLILILWGAYSFFKSGVDAIAVLSGLVGLVTGAGTAIMRWLQKNLAEKAARLERIEEDQTRYLRAIQAALALTGPERNTQLAETTKWLRDGMRSAPQQAATRDA